jgi:hypothetical protein
MFLRDLKDAIGGAFVVAMGFSTFLISLVAVSTISYWLGISVLKLIGVIA